MLYDQSNVMEKLTKIPVLLAISLLSVIGYTALFSKMAGLKPLDLITVFMSSKGDKTTAGGNKGKHDGKTESALEDSLSSSDSLTLADQPQTSNSQLDSLSTVLSTIKQERAELEKTKIQIAALLKAKTKADSIQLYGLAKMYEGVDTDQLAAVFAKMDDSLVTEILPKMKSQRAGKILQAMPAERAARLSTKLLGMRD